MKSYNQVYNASKKEVVAKRKNLFENQKNTILTILKEEYMITGLLSAMDKAEQKKMLQRLSEYWSPKTGITEAGVKLINEHMITLTPNSNADDIRLYIQKQTKHNLVQITECFRMNNINAVVNQFNEDIKQSTGKTVKSQFIVDTVWNLISEGIKYSKW